MQQIAVRSGAQVVHLRRMGQGRPVALFHESPRSSHVLLDLAHALSDRFTVLAFDTPGYSLSDPMPMDRPSIDDFAKVLAGAMRALGVTNVPAYGIHTGATIAARMAVHDPGLISGLIFDGYPLFLDQERATHEAFYLPSFDPRWDGGHIAAMWSRVRDQHSHFPWYLRSQGSRLSYDWPLTRMRGVFHDILRSGPHYLTAYSSSFRFDGARALDQLDAAAVPYHLIARAQDVLSPHLSRFQSLPDQCSVQSAPPDQSGWSALVGALLARIPGQQVLHSTDTAIQPTPQGTLCVGAGRLACRVYGLPGPNTARVLLHGPNESGQLLADTARRLQPDTIIVPQMLAGMMPEDISCGLRDILKRLGIGEATVASLPGGGLPGFTADEFVISTAPQGPRHDAPLPHRMDGADLIAAWYRLRDAEIAHQTENQGDELFVGADIQRLHKRFVAEILSDNGGF